MDPHEYIKLFHNISTPEFDLLIYKLKSKTYKKGDFITVPGQIQKELYFVKSGVHMSYFDAANKTHVIAFTYFPN
jgi:CRP-like cAMP-binding protein